MSMSRSIARGALAVVALALVSCSGDFDSPLAPGAAEHMATAANYVTVYKFGPAGTYDFTATATGGHLSRPSFSLDAGSSLVIWGQSDPAAALSTVTVTEVPSPGTVVDSILVGRYQWGVAETWMKLTGTSEASVDVDAYWGARIKFFNAYAPPPPECFECKGKVTDLTMRYDGPAGQVRVVQEKDHVTLFDAWLETGETFSFTGAKSDGTMDNEISLYVNEQLHARVHTSCSQPIGPGMVVGDFEILSGSSRDNGLLCPVDVQPVDCWACKGKVTWLSMRYDGPAGQVRVVQEKEHVVLFDAWLETGASFSFAGAMGDGTMDTEIRLYVNDQLHTRIHTSCSQPIGPGMVMGDFEILAGGSRDNGLLCPVDIPPVDCWECRGKVTGLTMRYDGPAGQVRVVQEKEHVVLFDHWLETGASFSFSGAMGDGTMDTEISLYVDDQFQARIHTSCSQPIGPGMVVGNFEILAGSSRDGGLLCPVNLPPPGETGFCVSGVKPQALTLVYTGEDCTATSNSQDPGKVSCTGDPAGASPVRIVANDRDNALDGKIWFDGSVVLGGAFEIDALNAGDTRLTADTRLHILDAGGTLLQLVKFHTSCSQPLNPDDQFGSLRLTGLRPQL